MLFQTTVVIDKPVFGFLSFTRIRDKIVVDQTLQNKIEDATFEGSLVSLIARVIEHEPGFVLRLPGRHLRLIATEYNAKGGALDVSGGPGSIGNTGADGIPGYASGNPDNSKPGGAGGSGGSGGPGSDALTIQLVCEKLHDARLIANGGAGGKGGDGGDGGDGGRGHIFNKPGGPDPVEGTDGGPGGAAGPGGAGGKGGQIHIAYVLADAPLALRIDAKGGDGGDGGARGQGGKGFRDGGPRGSHGVPSHSGIAGAAGQTNATQVKSAEYWSHAAVLLGSKASAAWAAYRLEVGVYFYRVFNPAISSRAGHLQMAMQEFDGVLQLQPANADARRYQDQILHNQNVLGQPRNLDIIPDFPSFIQNYTAWASLVSSEYDKGIELLLTSHIEQAAANFFSVYAKDIELRIPVNELERDAAKVGQVAAQQEVEYATTRVNEINDQIRAAMEEMKNHSITIGSVVATVAEVGGVVVSVVAAVPTGGASLVALVPDLAALFTTVSLEGPAIFDELFSPSAQEMQHLKAAYGRVGKDVKDVYVGVQAVISLVSSVQKLQKLVNSTAPDNTKFVSLIRQAVERAHELGLAQLHNKQAALTLEARETQLTNNKTLHQIAKVQLAQLGKTLTALKDAGHTAVLRTQGYIDTLLATAFKAERSVEIYTFRDETAYVSFDSGYVYPDVEHDYADGDIEIPELISQYRQSWKALDLIFLQKDYENYFAGDAKFDLAPGVVFRSFTDLPSLTAFKTTRTLHFSIDLMDLPAEQYEAKIEDVHVALVGATAPPSFVNCQVRHGVLYLLEARTGKEVVMPLQPHVTQRVARFTPLQVVGTLPTVGAAALSAPQNLSFWGRGVAGDWELKVPSSEIVDLSGLTEIQVWVATQVFILIN